jgi:hypothetical protein
MKIHILKKKIWLDSKLGLYKWLELYMRLTNFYNTRRSLKEFKKSSLDLEVAIVLQALSVAVLKMPLKTTSSQ